MLLLEFVNICNSVLTRPATFLHMNQKTLVAMACNFNSCI